ncbi:MAG: putative bifunctional diguanylate cyclase/phosphodiesterase [Rhodomicrobiaceae bacterium]
MKLDQDAKLTISTVVVIISAIAASWVAMGEAQQVVLKHEAKSTAVRWAQFLQKNLTGLDDLLAAGLVSNADRVTFDFALATGSVSHYQVLNSDGAVAFSSWLGDFQTTSSRPDIAKAILDGEILTDLIVTNSAREDRAVFAEAYVPLTSAAGHKGAIKVDVDLTDRALQLERIRVIAFLGLSGLLTFLSVTCGILIWRNIRNRRWAEDLQGSRNVVLEQLATGMPLKQVLTTLIASVERLKPDTMCSVLLLDETGMHLREAAAPSLPDFYRAAVDGVKIGPGIGSCGAAAYSGETVIVQDLLVHENWAAYRDLVQQAGLRACWSQPIFSSGDQVLGTLAMYYREPRQPTLADIEFFRTITHLVGIAVAQRRFQAEIANMAHYDAVTGLHNRRAFQTKLQEIIGDARAQRRNAAVAIVDIDRFKNINDTYGHPMGDAVIQEMARRLSACVREDDVVARLGGDEFAIIFNEIEGSREIDEIATRIAHAVSVPMEIEGKSISTSTSIGVSRFPQHANTADELFVKADHALYQAKQKGRRIYQIYDEELHETIREKQLLEHDAQIAIQRAEFTLVYQPKVDLRSGAMMGLEALARWNHPVLGPIPPSKFIPIMETSTLMIDLGEWLLSQACNQAALWHAQGLTNICVAVNVAARQFKDPRFVEKVTRILEAANLNPASLEIEITETMLIDDLESVEETLAGLNRLGVSISIDDFGTGYSSLLYLTRFPLQSLKIDQSFVSNVPGNADSVTIVTSILAMARRMNLSVVAEGVETADQLKFLRANGCGFGQGYLFARPLEPDRVLDWYRSEFQTTICRKLFEAESALLPIELEVLQSHAASAKS